MRTRILSALIAICALFNAQAKEFYEDLSKKQRQELAQAYREAGQYFLSIGETERGAFYVRQAEKIEPPADLKEQAAAPQPKEKKKEQSGLPQAGRQTSSMILPVQPRALARPYPNDRDSWPEIDHENNSPEDTINELFTRFLAALATENIDLAASVCAPTLALPGYEESLDKERQMRFFAELFAAYQFNSLYDEDIYDMSSVRIQMFDESRALLTVTAASQAPPALAGWSYWEDFWGAKHHLFFEKTDGQWGLLALDMAYEDN